MSKNNNNKNNLRSVAVSASTIASTYCTKYSRNVFIGIS